MWGTVWGRVWGRAWGRVRKHSVTCRVWGTVWGTEWGSVCREVQSCEVVWGSVSIMLICQSHNYCKLWLNLNSREHSILQDALNPMKVCCNSLKTKNAKMSMWPSWAKILENDHNIVMVVWALSPLPLSRCPLGPSHYIRC